MKALIVDDSRVVRLLLSHMLRDGGFTEVAQAQDGKEALAYFAGNPDTRLAMVDLNMPEMDGIELVEAVRRDSRLNDVHLIMVSTDNEMSEIQRALTLGANDYIMKPFTKSAISDKLRLLGFGA